MAKQEADSCLKLRVTFLKQRGFFSGRYSGSIVWGNHIGSQSTVGISVFLKDPEDEDDEAQSYIRLYYIKTKDGAGKQMDYTIDLVTTPCTYGGVRYWFICPMNKDNKPCDRRAGTLYLAGDYFGCRHCYDLTYASRNLSGREKLTGKMVSFPELDEYKEQAKRPFYGGKKTKKYKRYLNKESKCLSGLYSASAALEGRMDFAKQFANLSKTKRD